MRRVQGETVVDLGSGGGFDCFLAARKVGPTGKVIGVDMTEVKGQPLPPRIVSPTRQLIRVRVTS